MKKQLSSFQKELLKQMVTLATSGFGLVAALAWNEAIQAFIQEYVNKYLSSGTGVVSKFLYAVVITMFAVIVTYQLTRLIKADEEKGKK